MTDDERAGSGRAAEGEIEIDAPAERVWRALTEARELERWFPLEARVEPGPDGRIWMGWGHGLGGWSSIEAWDPPRHLRVSWLMGEGPAQVTDYVLEGRGGRTHLRVVTSGFPDDGSWDDMVESTRLGWRFELRQLKHYLERHAGEDRRAVFLRRRVGLSREEAWARLTGDEGVLDHISGELFDRTRGWQLAAAAAGPGDALLRVSIDPSHDEPEMRDVSVWLGAWGDDGARVREAAGAWAERLDRLFPEARKLDESSSGA